MWPSLHWNFQSYPSNAWSNVVASALLGSKISGMSGGFSEDLGKPTYEEEKDAITDMCENGDN